MTAESDTMSPPTVDELDRFVREHLERFRVAVPWFLEEHAIARKEFDQCSELVGVYCRIVGESRPARDDPSNWTISERRARKHVRKRNHKRPERRRRPDPKSKPSWGVLCSSEDQRVAAMLLLVWLVTVDSASIEPIGGPPIVLRHNVSDELGFTSFTYNYEILCGHKYWQKWRSWAWEHRDRLLSGEVVTKEFDKSVPILKHTKVNVQIESDSNGTQPAPLTASQRITLCTMVDFDLSDLLSVARITDAIDPMQSLSEETVRKALSRLIELGLAERPEGPRNGARLTIDGLRNAGKIAD